MNHINSGGPTNHKRQVKMPLPLHGKNVLYCHDQQSRCLGSYACMSLDRSSQGLHTTARCSLRLHNRCKYSVIWLVKHDVCQKLLNTDRKSLHWPARIAEQTTGILSLRAHRPHVVFERGYQFYLTAAHSHFFFSLVLCPDV